AGDVAAVLAGVDDVRVGGVRDREAGLAAADTVPVREGDAVAAQAVAGRGARADVLHRPGHAIGHAVVGGDVVELADRQRRSVPGLAAAGRDIDAAVVAVDHPPGVLRIDPEIVMVAVMSAFDLVEALAAVDALEETHLRGPDDIGIHRVDGEGGVVPGALAEITARVDELPGVAAVVGAEQAAFVRLDERIDTARVGRRHGHADLAPDALGQTGLRVAGLGRAGDLFPGVAAVARD